MKYKYKLTLEIDSNRALKAVNQYLIQEHRVFGFVETKTKPHEKMACIDLVAITIEKQSVLKEKK